MSEHLVLAALAGAARWVDPALHDHVAGRTRPLSDLLAAGVGKAGSVPAGRDGQARVGILMPNSASWYEALFAAMAAGAMAIPLPLPAGFVGPQAYVEHVLLIAETARLDAVLVHGAAMTPTLKRIRQRAPGVEFVDIAECPVTDVAPAPADADRPCVVQFTSGSTGRPKGVVLTQANVVAALEILRDQLFLTPTDRLGSWLPLFHDMGLFMTLTAFASGAGVELWAPSEAVRRPLRWLEQFAAAGCTTLAAPNFFYEALATAVAEADEPPAADLRGWRFALNGAETVRAESVRRFTEALAPLGFHPAALWPVYGLAEATLPGTLQEPGRPYAVRHVDRDRLAFGAPVAFRAGGPGARAVVACGRPLRRTALRIADGDRELPPGSLGEVQLHGPTITPGYLDLPPSAGPRTPTGWLRTGDLGFVQDGELFITGRLKNMASVNGHNVHAEDVEDVVRSVLGGHVRCGAVAGVDDDGAESVRVVFETSAEGADRAAEEKRVREGIAHALGAIPVDVVGVLPRSIPHTSSGKVQRQQLSLRA